MVKSHVGANDYRAKMRSKTKMYHVNVLKKYIAKEPEVNVVHTSNKDDTTILARVVHQDTDSELEKVPDLEVKLGEDLFEDQQCILKELIWRHPDVFTDMPRETDVTDVIQHIVKLKDNTPIHCKLYPLLYAKREELCNEVDSKPETGEMRLLTLSCAWPIIMVKNKDCSKRVGVDFRKLNKITEVDPEPMATAEDLFRRLSGTKYLSN